MATLSSTNIGNIFDVMKVKLPNGSAIDNILNALSERDDFMRFVPAFPANNGMSNHGLRTVTLPTGYIVNLGGSWKSSKSQREPYVEDLLMMRSTYQAPVDTFQAEKPEVGKALLKAEQIDHVMMLNQSLSNVILNGSSTTTSQTLTSGTDQSKIIGIAERAPYLTHDNKFTFNVGGTGTNLRSCWLMKPGIDTFFMTYNGNHPTLGIEKKDKGEQLIQNLGTDDDEHRYDIFIEFMLTKGIFLRDQRALKRICNIPAGPTDIPGVALLNQIIRASIINAPTGGTMQVEAEGRKTDTPAPWLLMCDEWVYSHLVIEANDKLKVHTSNANIYTTDLPMIGPNIIIARWDALNRDLGDGEAVVAAAS